MQPRLRIKILVLQPERLVRVRVNLHLRFQTTPSGVVSIPQQIAELVGHLPRNADLVGVEISEVLLTVFGVVKDLRQRFVAVLAGVDIGVAAFVGVLLQ